MNKSRAPKIPPLLVDVFILNCREKTKSFNSFSSNQCMLITNSSVLPIFNFLTDDSVGMPLKMIFENILVTSLYPDSWKLANVTPIYKKGDKQSTNNYRPISLLPNCGKTFENIIFNNRYSYLNANNLITKNQSGFRPGDSTTNQLLFLVDEIHQAFEDTKSLEVRAVFLDISKAFDKVWHDGLIFKLKQNGISGSLLKFFESYLHNRKQCVVLNGSFFDYSVIQSGVSQGSVLGPLLFLI